MNADLSSLKQTDYMNRLMQFEILRLQSFKDARPPTTIRISTLQFAQEGFYFDRTSGRLLCFSCGCEFDHQFTSVQNENVHSPDCRRVELNRPISNGTQGLSQELLAQHFSQRCHLPTIQREEIFSGATNMTEHRSHENGILHDSLTETNTTHLSNNQQQFNISSNHINETETSRSPVPRSESNDHGNNSSQESSHVSEQPHLNLSVIAYPQFSTRQARLKTFMKWNPVHSHQPHEFAEAGFFYTGYGDCVRCFCCGLGLKCWRLGDVIPDQHAHIRPDCAFNRLYTRQGQAANVQPEELSQQGAAGHGRNQRSQPSPTAVEMISTGVDENSHEMSDSSRAASNSGQATPSIHHKIRTGAQTLKENLRLVEREHMILQERTNCQFCQSKMADCMFLPCGHLLTCQNCAEKINHCIVCAKAILATINVFLS